MSVKFQVQMTDKYMCDFMLYHNYTHASGLMAVIAGLLCVATFVMKASRGDIQSASIWLICSIVFLVMNPYSVKNKAKMQVQNTPMFQKPLEYELNDEGIIVRQDDQEAVNAWDVFTKAVSTSKSIILYMGRVRAIVLPKECMSDEYEEVVKMIYTHMPMKKVKIR